MTFGLLSVFSVLVALKRLEIVFGEAILNWNSNQVPISQSSFMYLFKVQPGLRIIIRYNRNHPNASSKNDPLIFLRFPAIFHEKLSIRILKTGWNLNFQDLDGRSSLFPSPPSNSGTWTRSPSESLKRIFVPHLAGSLKFFLETTIPRCSI